MKRALAAGREAGLYTRVADDVVRPGPEERRSNPRSVPVKLRWAVRADAGGDAAAGGERGTSNLER